MLRYVVSVLVMKMDFCDMCQELLPVLANLRNDTISNDEQYITQLHEKLVWLKDALKPKDNRYNSNSKWHET